MLFGSRLGATSSYSKQLTSNYTPNSLAYGGHDSWFHKELWDYHRSHPQLGYRGLADAMRMLPRAFRQTFWRTYGFDPFWQLFPPMWSSGWGQP